MKIEKIVKTWMDNNAPSIYAEGLSWYEALIILSTKINDVIDQVNLYFDEDLEDVIVKMLNEWKDDGTLSEIINSTLLDSKADKDNVVLKGELVVNVKDFGAVGDGVTDDSQAIQEANDYCLENDLMMFSNSKHFLAESVTINCNADLENATFLFDGRQDKSVKIVSYNELPDDVRVTSKNIRLPFIKNINFTATGYPSLEQTAVYIRGLSRSKVHFNEIWGFKTGVHLESDDTKYSIAWSDFIFTFFLNNETAMLIEQSGTGWINSNMFTSFGASQYSNTNSTVNNNLVVNSEKAGATGVDNNVFIACDFEDRRPREVDTYAVTLKNLTNTVFLGCRWEMANKNFVKIDGGISNIFIGGYGLNPAYIREVNNPNYALYWQNRITTKGIVQTGALQTTGRLTIKDGTAYPILVDHRNNNTSAYVKVEVDKGQKTGQLDYEDGKVTYKRETQRTNNGTSYTRIDAYGSMKIVTDNRFDIEASNSYINGSHIQTIDRCTSDNRPDMKVIGMMVFDTTLGKPIFARGEGVWIDANGTQV